MSLTQLLGHIHPNFPSVTGTVQWAVTMCRGLLITKLCSNNLPFIKIVMSNVNIPTLSHTWQTIAACVWSGRNLHSSHCLPLNPVAQSQMKESPALTHVAPFWQGRRRQSWGSSKRQQLPSTSTVQRSQQLRLQPTIPHCFQLVTCKSLGLLQHQTFRR